MAPKATHLKCRSIYDSKNYKVAYYTGGFDGKTLARPFVHENDKSWDFQHKYYEPIVYTSKKVLEQPVWADPKDPKDITSWNAVDGHIDRRSHMGQYKIVDGTPLNPLGRCGIKGRGLLGKWGPNHAADPIVTRWKLDEHGNNVLHPRTGKPVLEFVSIQRRDTGQWAIPGGMVDPGEAITTTMLREFEEEALNSLGENRGDPAEADKVKALVRQAFHNGKEIYKGYVDDPRNTDNSWMETTAYNFHDENGIFYKVNLVAGDDASHVVWKEIDSGLELYASHKEFIEATAQLHNAHW